MHDIKEIKADPAAFDRAMARRGEEVRADQLLALDQGRVANTVAMNEAQAAQKQVSKRIGQAKAQGDEAAAQAAMAEVGALKQRVQDLEEAQRGLDEGLREALLPIPNVMDEDVPDGADEDDNVELRRWGQPAEIENARDHVDLGEALGMMDFEAAAKLSGSRFVVLKKDLAKLERALATFMLNLHTEEFGYEEVAPPVLVNHETMEGTGQLPKFSSDVFSVYDLDVRIAGELQKRALERNAETIGSVVELTLALAKNISIKAETIEQYDQLLHIVRSGKLEDELQNKLIDNFTLSSEDGRLSIDDEKYFATLKKYPERVQSVVRELADRTAARLFLSPTAEVTLTNLVRDDILAEAELPKRYTAWTQCFRAEAGSSGRDTRGMIRMHQFSKVELVSITTPETSDDEHERMTGCAEEVLKRLDLPFRTMLLCSGDTGFGAAKTYDLEVWLPGQGKYREISSCSNTRAFQARRMNARYRAEGAKKPEFVHTLNGSGLAVGRTMVAVLENYQQPDGSIAVPDVLKPLMGKDVIEVAT